MKLDKFSDKYGFEFLESQVTIHNLLIKAQEVDEELEQASIQLMDSSYTNEDIEETTRIYIVRGPTEHLKRRQTHTTNIFNTQIEIIVMTSKHDVREAVKVLNSLTRAIDAYIHLTDIGAYCHLERIVPLYNNNGLIHEYRMVYIVTEYQELENYPQLCKNLKLLMKLTGSIRGEDEISRIITSNINEASQNLSKAEDVPFGGGK